MKYIIGNFKQHKRLDEYIDWKNKFFTDDLVIPEGLVCVLAPTYLNLQDLYEYLKENDREDLFLASQDVSQYKQGKHTGLVGSDQVSDFATFAIIGHSERRADGDTLEIVNKKIGLAIENGLTPIVCFSDLSQYKSVFDNMDTKNILFAFEPLSAIGSGKPESPGVINDMVKATGLNKVIYGGSVDVDNISDYLKMSTVAGFLVGTATLDPLRFKALIKKFN